MNRTLALFLVVLMAIPMVPFASAEDVWVEESSTAGGRQAHMAQVTAQNYNTIHYPGDNENFYINVFTEYMGAEYTGDWPAVAGYQDLWRGKVTFQGVTDDNYDPVTSSPITWVAQNVDDNTGAGFDWNSPWGSYNLYAVGGGNLEFTVNTDNVEYGTYYLHYRLTATLITHWDSGTLAYTNNSFTENFYYTLEVRQPIALTGFGAIDSSFNGETLYAGATNQRLGMNLNPISGTITNIHGTLTIADSHFQIRDPAAFASVTSGWDLLWFIDVAPDTPTRVYDVQVALIYDRNGDTITEADTRLGQITVQWTPLMEFPDHMGYTEPIATIIQDQTDVEIRVPIQNNGNVDLTSVQVELDLARASYFKNGNFVYDEANWGGTIWDQFIVDVGDVTEGQSKDAVFSDVKMLQNLPPGRYRIPMNYMGYYFDNGTFGASNMVPAGYWPTMGRFEHDNIHQDIDDPEPASTVRPYIYIRVVDDGDGVEMDASISNSYTPGSNNNYITMAVYNRERYTISNPVYTVHTDMGSPFKNVGVPDDDPSTTLPVIRDSSIGGQGMDYVYFFTSVRQGLMPGTYYIPVEIDAFDPYLNPLHLQIDVPVVINAQSPSFRVMNWETNISDQGYAEVTVTIKNVGAGGAHNISVFFQSNHNNMKGIDAPMNIGDLLPNDETTVTFRVKSTGESISMSGTFNAILYYGYVDDGGSVYQQFSTSTSFTYVIAPKLPNFAIVTVNAPGVKPGDTIDVVVDVMNIGGSTAYGTTVKYVSSQSYFGLESISGTNLGDMAPGENASVRMRLKASNALYDGTTYTLYLYFEYDRVDGYGMTYSEGDHESFQLHTVDEIEVNREEQVVEYRNAGQNIDYGLVMLGLFIFLAVLIAVLIMRKPSHPHPSHMKYDDFEREDAGNRDDKDWRRTEAENNSPPGPAPKP